MTAPSGLKTWLPSDVRKQQFVTGLMTELYESFGYEPIVIPSIVDLSVIEKTNSNFSADVFKLLDRDGKTLALRTELTQPIAKTIALRAEEISFPVKLYYNSNVFRYKGVATDDSREIKQVGVEYFGAAENQNYSDHEIVYLLVESSLKLGLKDFKVSITHSAIWKTIYEKLASNKDVIAAHKALVNGDLVEFRKLAERNSVLKIFLTSSKVEDFEKEIGINLACLKSLIENFPEYLVFDPLLCSDLNLYTGIHFSLYAVGEGKLLATGGRYDKLCASFGNDLPAIGFAFYVPRLLNLMLKQDLLPVPESQRSLLKPKSTWKDTLNEIRKLIHTKQKVFLKE